jgi:hypothetical protein
VIRSWFGIPPDALRDVAEAQLEEGLERLKLDQETIPSGSDAKNKQIIEIMVTPSGF